MAIQAFYYRYIDCTDIFKRDKNVMQNILFPVKSLTVANKFEPTDLKLQIFTLEYNNEKTKKF